MSNTSCTISEHLLKKRTQLVITNVCNLSCSGCHEFCGHFNKDQKWFMSPEDFDKYVTMLKPHEYDKGCNIQNPSEKSIALSQKMKKMASGKYSEKVLSMFDYSFVSDWRDYAKISVFGGEPTIHPQWEELLEIMYSHYDITFKVSTNGRLGHKCGVAWGRKRKNVIYIADVKRNQIFTPTLIAPIDLIPDKPKMWFWDKAQKDCNIWRSCASSIYKGKAYFCEAAGAMDHLFNNGENGWEIKDNEYPFYKTKEEIDEQASKFCYRCAWCIKDEPILSKYVQRIKEPEMISSTNLNCLNNSKQNLVQINLPCGNEPVKNVEESVDCIESPTPPQCKDSSTDL